MINEPLFTNLCLAASPWYSVLPRWYYTYGRAIANRELAAYLGGDQAVQLAIVWAHTVFFPSSTYNTSGISSAEAMATSMMLNFDLTNEEQSVVSRARGILRDVAAYKNTQDTLLFKDVTIADVRLPYEQFVKASANAWKDVNPKQELNRLSDSRSWLQYMQGRFYCFSTERAREEWDHQAKENISRYAKVDT